jgi:hypothetical protein
MEQTSYEVHSELNPDYSSKHHYFHFDYLSHELKIYV